MQYGWRIVDHQVVFKAYFQIEKYALQHELYAGGDTETFYREVFERGSAAALLPYDPLRDEVVLIEQFRVGTIGTLDSPWIKEIVAGIIDPGETPEQVAHRESMEEAGCEILALEKISDYFVSPGGSTEQCALYCGRIDSSKAGGIFGLPHEHEDIRAEVVSLSRATQWLNDGTINSATPIIALQWLLLNRDRLRQQWT